MKPARATLFLFFSAPIVLGVAAVLGQSGERIEFRADETVTEFIEGGVLKRYTGNVTAISGDLRLAAREAVYDSRIGETRLYGDTALRDSVRTVWADTLIYTDRRREAVARGNVRGAESGRSFRAGWVRYRRMERLIEGFGGVSVRDDSIRSTVTGLSMAFDDSTKNALVVGMPVLVREDESGAVMILTAADTVLVLRDTRTARVWSGVTVTRDSMTARSERAVYDDRAERVTLMGKPVLTHVMHGTGDEDGIPIRVASEATGDTVYVQMAKRVVTSVRLEGNTAGTAVAVTPAGVVYYRSVLESRRMILDMAENRVTAMTAEGAASSYYMHAPTPSGRKMFVNTARGDTIRFFFDGGRISDMRIFGAGSGDAAGKYYEYEPVKAGKDSVRKEGTKAQRQKGKK